MMEWVKGMKVRADDGFSCIQAGSVLEVKESDVGPYVECTFGKHYLCGDEPGFECVSQTEGE
jgi:hypothetical protein